MYISFLNLNYPKYVFMHSKWDICIKKAIILFLMLYKSNKKVIHIHKKVLIITDSKLHLCISQPALPK